jgi:hypothetical protein
MPNELKTCSGFSTSNLAHPADHYTPLRTDPLHVDLGGQWAYRQFQCLAKTARANQALSIGITQSSLRGQQLFRSRNWNSGFSKARYPFIILSDPRSAVARPRKSRKAFKKNELPCMAISITQSSQVESADRLGVLYWHSPSSRNVLFHKIRATPS